MFDFLIDIVPREEAATKRAGGPGAGTAPAQHGGGGAAGMMPPQQQAPGGGGGPPGGQPQHHMSGYEGHGIGGGPMPQEEYGRPQPGLYQPQVAGDPVYGQPQSQGFEGMYGPPSMYTQPVSAPPLIIRGWFCMGLVFGIVSLTRGTISQMYGGVNQRSQIPPGGQDPGHHYQRHDGDGDADAEGDRDYEVG